RGERTGRGRALRSRRGGALDECEADHRAIAEIGIDPLEQDRLAMLNFERQGGDDAQPQRAVAALAAREAELDRPAVAREVVADDRRPLLEELGLAQSLLAEHRRGDAGQVGADRLHEAMPLVPALASQRPLRWSLPRRHDR